MMANYEENFVFAFNDFDFSDRVLRLEIVPDYHFIDSNKSLRGEKHLSKDSKSCVGAEVKTLHINSAILAAKSPFFYKLFKNGITKSQNKNDVSIKINASEEATLMDILKFMYGNTLSATSTLDLVQVLIAADKFEANSCMRHCIEMLLKFPMSLKCALFYLELPSSVLVREIVKPLIDAAKQYVVARYRDFTKSKELMQLPLCAIEVVLGSEGLRVTSEDDIFDFILMWARVHYPELEECREILTKLLVRYICFPNMSPSKLKEVLVCPNFKCEKVSKLLVDALCSKVEDSYGQHIHAQKDLATTHYGFPGRVYSTRCVVFFNLRKDELKSLFPFTSKRIKSQSFCLGGKSFYLLAQFSPKDHKFGLFVCKANWLDSCTVDYRFAVMNKSTKEFQSKFKANNQTISILDRGWGTLNLLRISCTDLKSDDDVDDYFINGILHLRAEITLVNNSEG